MSNDSKSRVLKALALGPYLRAVYSYLQKDPKRPRLNSTSIWAITWLNILPNTLNAFTKHCIQGIQMDVNSSLQDMQRHHPSR